MTDTITFCRGGGCTAKLGPGVLKKVLEKLPKTYDPNLLSGFDHNEDAAVYRLRADLAIVQTLDFFPPMVEDPYTFGQIAAANALSDIYAMGGEVKTALNIVCFPEHMDLNILGAILQGGNDKVTEAGGVLAGGHSIQDSDIKYGLSVTGTIHPDRILSNCGCKPGDVLLLTKPLGTGILCTAARLKAVSSEQFQSAVKSMTTLNKYAAEVLASCRVHACTDVTGFGLIGHLLEMLGEENCADLYADQLPILPGAKDCAEEFYLTAGGQRNRNHGQNRVAFLTSDFSLEEILYDPQTSGGLLVSLPEEDALRILPSLEGLDLKGNIIGTVIQREAKDSTEKIRVLPSRS